MFLEMFLLLPLRVILYDLRQGYLAIVNLQAVSRYLGKLHHRNQRRQQNLRTSKCFQTRSVSRVVESRSAGCA